MMLLLYNSGWCDCNKNYGVDCHGEGEKGVEVNGPTQIVMGDNHRTNQKRSGREMM